MSPTLTQPASITMLWGIYRPTYVTIARFGLFEGFGSLEFRGRAAELEVQRSVELEIRLGFAYYWST